MNTSTFTVDRCPDWLIRPTVERDHYLHEWPHPKSLPFGYVLKCDGASLHHDGRPWGLVMMKRLQHSRQRGLFGYDGLPTCWQVLDLARVWVHPSLQEVRWSGIDRTGRPVEHSLCVFSRMVRQVLARVQRDWIDHHPPVFPDLPYHVRLILSYCELAHHDGVSYRASGFERVGLSTDGRKEVYVRRLKRPAWRWQPQQRRQLRLFEEAA